MRLTKELVFMREMLSGQAVKVAEIAQASCVQVHSAAALVAAGAVTTLIIIF